MSVQSLITDYVGEPTRVSDSGFAVNPGFVVAPNQETYEQLAREADRLREAQEQANEDLLVDSVTGENILGDDPFVQDDVAENSAAVYNDWLAGTSTGYVPPAGSPSVEEATEAAVAILQQAGITPDPDNLENVLMGDGGWMAGIEVDFEDWTATDILKAILPGPLQGVPLEVLGVLKEAGADIGSVLSGEQSIGDVLGDWGEAAQNAVGDLLGSFKGSIESIISNASTIGSAVGSIGNWVQNTIPSPFQGAVSSYIESNYELPPIPTAPVEETPTASEPPTNVPEEPVTPQQPTSPPVEPENTRYKTALDERSGFGPSGGGESEYWNNNEEYASDVERLRNTNPIDLTDEEGLEAYGPQWAFVKGTDWDAAESPIDPTWSSTPTLDTPPSTTPDVFVEETPSAGGGGGGGEVVGDFMAGINTNYQMLNRRNVVQQSLIKSLFGDLL